MYPLPQVLANSFSIDSHNADSHNALLLGNAIDSGIGLSITIDKLRVFINKTLSILSAYQ